MRALADAARSSLVDGNRSDQRPRALHRGADPTSFDAFVVRSRADLFRALAAQFHHETATEALADAYAYAWKHWDALALMENPTGYVYRIAERVALRAEIRNRNAYSTQQVRELSDSETPTTGVGSSKLSDSRWLEDYESDVSVVEILRVLPSRQRACVLLIHAYGWTYKQAALTLDLPITTVTNEATRGMARLRNNKPVQTAQLNHSNEPLPRRKSERA
jgi:DNA-directed RNA polymerase specialized sigma24 family protein